MQPCDTHIPIELDKPHEECGVFGIFAPGEDVARLTFFGLYALQHRGQESAGIATTNGHQVFRRAHLGLVSQAVSYTHLRAHETDSYLVCRLLLEKKKKQ